jgi:putative ABC transport system permease protein
MVEGDWDGLQNRNAIFLSASSARAFFGKEDALGKRMKSNNRMDAVVTGIYKDLPPSSTLHELTLL